MIFGFSVAATHHEHEPVRFPGSGAAEEVQSVPPPTPETLSTKPASGWEGIGSSIEEGRNSPWAGYWYSAQIKAPLELHGLKSLEIFRLGDPGPSLWVYGQHQPQRMLGGTL